MAKKLALFIVVALTPWVFFDLDLGDQPYMTLVGWLMAHYPMVPAGTYPYWFEAVPVWGSFVPDFFLFKILGTQVPMLVFRFVWIGWHVLIACLLFSILKRWWDPKKLAVALGLTVLACVVGADHYALSYYSVPVGYAVLSIALFALATETDMRWAVASGVLFILALSSRFSATPFFLLYWILIFVFFKKLRPLARWLLWGCFLGGVLVYLLLLLTHQDQYVIPGVANFFEGVRTKANIRFQGMAQVLPKMFMHYLRIAVGAVLFITLVAGVSKPRSQQIRKLFYAIATVVLTVLSYWKYGVVLAIVIGGALCLLLGAFQTRKRKLNLFEWILGLGSLMVLIAFPFGTYSEGLQFYKYGLWLLLPFAFLLKVPGNPPWLTEGRKLLGASILILFVTTRIFWPSFPYQEKNIFKMTTAYEAPHLKGIFTYKEKAQSLNKLFSELQRLGVKPGDQLFAYAGSSPFYPISLIYEVTSTIPLFHDPGLMEYPGARWPRYSAMLGKEALPSVIVRQRSIYSEPPKTEPFQWTKAPENWLAGEVDTLLKGRGYKPVWQDGYFVILQKSN